ncbi:type VI secretion protein [Streptomyces sp. NPDC101160]|uniref:type VI secretion protein n=1 Tax=Streptomyces sp. NPDC101160 TaxID=3366118 RepID=UPI00382F32B9
MEKAARKEGGIPDGLVVGLLALLLALAFLVWTATGLAALFAHGTWPAGVTFTRTPLALRSLMTAPTDLPTAWPDAAPAQLSGYGLFWGLLIGEAMVLAVLTVFALGTLARWRAVRANRKAGAYGENRDGRAPGAARGAAVRGKGAAVRAEEGVAWDKGASVRAEGGAAWGKGAAARTEGAAERARDAAAQPEGGVVRAEEGVAWDNARTHGATTEHVPVAEAAYESRPVERAPLPVPATAAPPHPRTPTDDAPARAAATAIPRIVYGPAATRRPAAVQAVGDADGAVLVVTSDPSLWAETKDARGKLGPVLLYDPGHLCDTPARLRWSPAEGCEDPDRARERAAALLAPVRPQARLDAATADTAETLLRCWLHAAATDGRPFKQVHRWAQGADAHEPVRILRTHPKAAAGHAGLLESALTAHQERRAAAQELTARALGALSSIHIRDACTANRTDSLTLASFVAEQGTLYVVGEPIEDPRTHPGAMPLLTALAASVVEHGRRMAARSSDGRLDPPLSLVLDDVAAVAPLPGLPELVAAGAEQGLPTLALMRSQEQARARWPEPLPFG